MSIGTVVQLPVYEEVKTASFEPSPLESVVTTSVPVNLFEVIVYAVFA